MADAKAELAQVRKRIDVVLAHLEGRTVDETAQDVGFSPPTVRKWVRRYAASGIEGLMSKKPPGRPAEIHPAIRGELVRLPQETRPPHDLGEQKGGQGRGDQWSTRLLGQVFNVSPAFVSQVWQEAGFDPPLHLQQVLAQPARSVNVTLEIRVPAWLRMHWELCQKEGDPQHRTREAFAALTRPDEWAGMRQEIVPTLERRWTDRNEQLPRVDPRRDDYWTDLERRYHGED